MTSSTLVQAQPNQELAALNPVSRWGIKSRKKFSLYNVVNWQVSVTEDYILDEDKRFEEAAEKVSILSLQWLIKKSANMMILDQYSNIHCKQYSNTVKYAWADHATWAKGDLPAECQQCQQLRHLQVL